MAYLLPVLGGLTRQEMEKEALPPLMEQDLVDERLLKRMIGALYGRCGVVWRGVYLF